MVEHFKETRVEADASGMPEKASTQRRPRFDFTLADKYEREEGTIILSGIQALVRLPLDQHRADVQRSLRTATLISGYRGSPLGGLDMELSSAQKLLSAHEVRFMPGLNEDLAATAVFGSQLANLLPNPRHDGVLGMWYGKAPGVDRSGDALKHANFAGVGRYGGVLALAGDDPNAKSSTLPSATETNLYDALMPVLFPGNIQDVLDYGRLGFELSRYSGLWVGFKVVTNVADEFSSAEVSTERVVIQDPGFEYRGKPWRPNQNPNLLTPYSLTIEREIFEGRLEAARLFGVTHHMNPVTLRSVDDWIGIIAAGKTYYDLRQAFHEMGLSEDDLNRFGVRLMKVGMMYPMDRDSIIDFARGLEEIFVIEEKRAFIELFVRDALYSQTERPRIVGKEDTEGHPLVPKHGELDADAITRLIAGRLQQRINDERISARIQVLNTPALPLTIPLTTARSPYYCSGCPHNTSTLSVPDDAIVGGGIGCHTMTVLMDQDKTKVTGLTQMGGEGVQWVGASPFSDTEHIFQNIGDGTLFHSGTLAIRQAVAADTHITYKILWNSAVAMTGGQDPEVEMPVWRLTHLLTAEGVKKIIVTTKEPQGYPAEANWATGVEIWEAERIEEAQLVLRTTPGVTVLIHDQECAAELRRKRRRGYVPDPELRVFINEAVCEGCGDCGVKSNCLSVFPVETEMGRKTQIHQSSCNKDYSCLDGHCPAFITVIPNTEELKANRPFYEVDIDLPTPEPLTEGVANIYMMGIGGTGVVTTNQVLGTAAMLDGKYVSSLDQTGLSQKGGPVVSNMRIMDDPSPVSSMVANGTADCYLVLDLLTGTDVKHLSRTNPQRSVAIVSTSEVPTGDMVTDTGISYPKVPSLRDSIDQHTRRDLNVYFDAIAVSEALFGTHMPANIMTIGAAYQRGLIPVSAEAIERAIELNGVAVKVNTQAFRVGRRIVLEPDFLETVQVKRAGDLDYSTPVNPEAQTLIDLVGAAENSELRRLLEVRIPDLIDYQNAAYARQYADFVREVYNREQLTVPGQTELSENVARYLYKLMAYKDEYEVARLHMKSNVKDEMAAQFGSAAKYQYMLYPPTLRFLGIKRKLKLGRWFEPMFSLLLRMKFLRGTPLDVFGWDEVRRTERKLRGQYRDLINEALTDLNPQSYGRAVKLAGLPDMIRGYDHIKMGNVKAFWEAVERVKTDRD